jgi:DNA-binding Lrp family transcriptional regulator
MEFYSKEIGITKKGVEYQIYKMVDEGILKRERARKKGKWLRQIN